MDNSREKDLDKALDECQVMFPPESSARLLSASNEVIATGIGWMEDGSGQFRPLYADLDEGTVKFVEIDGTVHALAAFKKCRAGSDHYHFSI